MGLDITAYRQLTPAPDAALDEYGEPVEWDTHVTLSENPNFPGRAEGATLGVLLRAGEAFRFRAGSYGGYSQWREWLARLAGYPSVSADPDYPGERAKPHSQGAWAATEGPFWELINFADNEGVIGPVVAKKLAADFEEWAGAAEDAARAMGAEGAWFIARYADWRRAFEWASDNGAVDFH